MLAVAGVGMARATASEGKRAGLRVDSHLHLWTPDVEKYPAEVPIPEHLNKDGRGRFENYIQLMDATGVGRAIVVQPVNYGQDYSYLKEAFTAYPTRLWGMCVADPRIPATEATAWLENIQRSHSNWVGLRFNPYKWPEQSAGMADETGKAVFRRAGELGLVVGVMAFKGVRLHLKEIEALLVDSPQTKVVIDHWGFFLQPATGFGEERKEEEESWEGLLKLARYPQVYVKISALFRVAKDNWPYSCLDGRLRELLAAFTSNRLLWGSDFPYATEHDEYSQAVGALQEWPVWAVLSEEDRQNLMGGTAARLFNLPVLHGGASEEL